MQTIKCSSCGVVNWQNAEICVRCRTSLNSEAPASPRPFPRPAAASSNPKKYIVPAVFVVWGLGMVVLGYVVFFKQSVRSSGSQTEVASTAATTTGDGSPQIPAPPPEMGITAPSIAQFGETFRNDIIQQNGTMTIAEGIKKPSNGKPVWDTEVIDRMSARCKGGGGLPDECKSQHDSIVAEIAAREHNKAMAQQLYCPPKIDGPITLAEVGRYHRFDDKIYFSAKVSADGLVGYHENGGCRQKASVVPLTAKVYLKWSRASNGWSVAAPTEFSRASLDYHNKKKETKKEEIEKARSERWKQQGQIAANKQAQTRAFRALNE